MKRLIIIGNGFDLGHDLKTSYLQFVQGYLKTSIATAFEKRSYEDELISIEPRYEKFEFDTDISTIDKFIEHFNSVGYLKMEFDMVRINDYYNRRSPITFKIKSKLFRRLIERCRDHSWGGIEADFYELLIEAANNTTLRSAPI